MISYYDGQLRDILPSNITKYPEVRALSYALQQACRRLYRYAQQISIYTNLDIQPERVIDLLALELRTQYYKSTLDLATKRQLVKNTINWYMTAGTPKAVEELVQIVFGDGKVQEWFEYGGEPYCFRISMRNIDVDFGKNEEFKQLLSKVKRLSAHLDAIQYIFDYIIQQPISYKTVLKLTSEFYPRSNIPFLKYDGTAQYNDTVRYDKYKSAERIALYPIRLHIASEISTRMFFFPKIQMQQIFSVPIYHTETTVGYVQENKLYTTLEQALQIKLQTPILPHYEISLKIGKHPNRYDGKTKYDGKSRYYVANIEKL